MKIFITIIFSMAFCSTIAAQSKIIPIMDMRSSALIGGVENGKWLKPERVIPTLKDQTEFVIAGFGGVEEGGVTTGKKRAIEGVCDANYQTFEMDLESKNGIAVGSNAKWNIVPRLPKEISTSGNEYKTIIGSFLKANKIAKTQVVITQAFRIDLDGDKTEEVVLSATYYRKGMYESPALGDYSFVLLRKVIGGKAQNILVAGDFIIKKGDYPPPNKYEITGLADLNGDGRMEIVVESAYYEGATQTVFEIKANKPAVVLQVGCGL